MGMVLAEGCPATGRTREQVNPLGYLSADRCNLRSLGDSCRSELHSPIVLTDGVNLANSHLPVNFGRLQSNATDYAERMVRCLPVAPPCLGFTTFST